MNAHESHENGKDRKLERENTQQEKKNIDKNDGKRFYYAFRYAHQSLKLQQCA